MPRKKRDLQEVAAVTEPVAAEEVASVSDLRTSLEEIKTYNGVIAVSYTHLTLPTKRIV